MAFPKKQILGDSAFSLIELLVVIAIISVLSAAAVPAYNAIKGGGGLTQAASDISGTIEQARAYAMGNNTYVYVGLQEVDAINPTAADGVGRVVVAVVASKDGTRPYANTPSTLSSNIVGLSRPNFFDSTHLASDGSLTSAGNMSKRAGVDSSFVDLGNKTALTSFKWPLTGTPKYVFTKVIEFDPRGSARLQGSPAFDSSLPSYIEIPLLPAKGNVVLPTVSNQAALQIDGMTGAVRIYRP